MRKALAAKRLTIRVGDVFVTSGERWTVTEDLRFGQGYWVVSADRCRQTIFQRATLESMTRQASEPQT